MNSRSRIDVLVKSISYEAQDIFSFDLVSPDGSDLPEFQPGSHFDVFIDEGIIRQFSICNPPWDRSHYKIAVLLEEDGTGGSKHLCQVTRPGDIIQISEPRCMFKLSKDAKQHVLIAGGIGVTPLLCMAYWLQRNEQQFEFHYCIRTKEIAAFLKEVERFSDSGEVQFHFDGGDPSKGLDMKSLLASQESGKHLYYCGPPGFMNALKDASSHWEEGTVHFEHFSSEGLEVAARSEESLDEFQVKIASTGAVYEIPSYQSIVDVLRENGFDIDTSCEDGFCGTCLTRYLEGEPEHLDEVLDDEDHEEYVLICCARSFTPMLVLDL